MNEWATFKQWENKEGKKHHPILGHFYKLFWDSCSWGISEGARRLLSHGPLGPSEKSMWGGSDLYWAEAEKLRKHGGGEGVDGERALQLDNLCHNTGSIASEDKSMTSLCLSFLVEK